MNHCTRLIIARHGNTFNPGDIITRVGITDLPLVEKGLAQGRLLGTYLKQHHLIPDIIFTSELMRTQQTADAAQASMQTHLPLQTLALFNEIDYGPDENQAEETVIKRIGAPALAAWEAHAQVPAGWKVEPKEIIQGWLDFATELTNQHAEKTILVVTSNGIARFAPYLTGDFNRFSQEHSIKIATGNFCLFEKTNTTPNWHCQLWNIKP